MATSARHRPADRSHVLCARRVGVSEANGLLGAVAKAKKDKRGKWQIGATGRWRCLNLGHHHLL
ncbi:hypothetical protein B0T17DRAFT_516174, partial [Bombardia bombarda]